MKSSTIVALRRITGEKGLKAALEWRAAQFRE
jgi:hypothetical protein